MSLQRHTRPASVREERGQTLVEYALAMPIVLFLVIGTLMLCMNAIERMGFLCELDQVAFYLPSDGIHGNNDENRLREVVRECICANPAIDPERIEIWDVILSVPESELSSGAINLPSDRGAFTMERTTMVHATLNFTVMYKLASVPGTFYLFGEEVELPYSIMTTHCTRDVVLSRTADIWGVTTS